MFTPKIDGRFYMKGLNIVILKNGNTVVFTSKLYKYNLIISFTNNNISKIWFNPASNIMTLKSVFSIPNVVYLFKLLNWGLAFYSKFYFLTLKYIGKGYKFYKKKLNNTFSFYLGFSHLYYVYSINNKSFIKMKRWIYLFGSDYRTLRQSGFSLRNTRYANIFTERGVRFKKQILYKKTGKISSY